MTLTHSASSSLNALAQSRRQAWLAAVAPDEPHKLARRLAWDDLDAEILEHNWSASEGLSESGSRPWAPHGNQEDADSWWPALQTCRKELEANWDLALLPYDPQGDRPFVDLWWPIRCMGAEQLRKAITDLPDEWIDIASVSDQLADNLLERLCTVGEQVLWERFIASRTPGAMLLAHLGSSGDGRGTPIRELYEAFIRTNRRDGLASLLHEFPELGRWVGTVYTLWLEASEELLHRLCADREALVAWFGLDQTQQLNSVSLGVSDPHRGGRTVAILQFTKLSTKESALQTVGPRRGLADPIPRSACEHELKIVYKPKDMGVDAAYQAALEDLNNHSDMNPLRTLTVLTREGYGYMEWAPHCLCDGESELESFYINAGRLTAVLHVLGCTDCHHENLIACADQLLLIDTETLLEPELPDHIGEAMTESIAPTPSLLQRRLLGSVLRSGLLPRWGVVGASKRAVDISALGVRPPAKEQRSMPGWMGLNSDGMLIGKVLGPAELPTSQPVGIGASNPFKRHLEAFCRGFERQALVLAAQRDRWLASDGVLSRFGGLQRRIVLRDTHVYGAIQRQLMGPKAMRSPFAREMTLELMARSYLLAETRPFHWPVFGAEVRQMNRLDIPFFTHRIDGDALVLGNVPTATSAIHPRPALEELPGFIRTSGLAAAKERLEALNTEEIAFQLRLIRGAAAAQALAKAPKEPSVAKSPTEKIENFASIDPGINELEAAQRVGVEIMNLAIVDPKGEIEWLGIDLGADGESFSFGLVGHALYGGSIGIACFLQRLQEVREAVDQPDSVLRVATDPGVVVEAILRPLRELANQPQDDIRLRWWRDQPLGINGCGGVLLGLQLLGESDLAEVLIKAALPRALQSDEQLDLIGGSAGLIGPLLRQGGEAANRLAWIAGDRLLSKQNEEGAWGLRAHQPPLLGFSHGTAGFAAALARLHQSCGEERFRAGAAAALAYERSRFDPRQANWPSYFIDQIRSGTEPVPSFSVGWCHGAPGVALGRACLWGTALWDDHCAEEIEIALRTTAACEERQSDHLCCGNLGLLAVLELVGEGPWPLAQDVKDLCREAALRQRAKGLSRCDGPREQAPSLRCFPIDDEQLILPGFFTGLSGMGLALLQDPGSRQVLTSLLSAGLWPTEIKAGT